MMSIKDRTIIIILALASAVILGGYGYVKNVYKTPYEKAEECLTQLNPQIINNIISKGATYENRNRFNEDGYMGLTCDFKYLSYTDDGVRVYMLFKCFYDNHTEYDLVCSDVIYTDACISYGEIYDVENVIDAGNENNIVIPF